MGAGLPETVKLLARPRQLIRTYDAIYLQGYLRSDYSRYFPDLPNMKQGSTLGGRYIHNKRTVMARSLGFHIEGAAPLCPDIKDPETVCAGAQHRFMRDVPKLSRKIKRMFRNHVRKWLRKNLVPLDKDSDTSFETWLSHTDYPEWRKEELRRARFLKPSYVNKSFIKREFYPVPKNARWINSRSDWFKAHSGPIFHLIEQILFKLPWFIKRIPVSERSRYIYNLLFQPGFQYLGTDHTSFEAHMTIEIMNICEKQLYTYMVRNLPEATEFNNLCNLGIFNKQKCVMRNANGVTISQTEARMSGDMCTSLGNGFTNLMVMTFVAHLKGWKECVGVVEGDDGLFRIAGDIPSSEDFEMVGFTIKSEISNELGNAGFCQLYYAEGEYENLVDPLKILLRAGWTMTSSLHSSPEKLEPLALAKAYSMVCEAPANPITGALALWLIRNIKQTAKFDYFDSDRWWVEQCMKSNLDECIARALKGPTLSQRLFCQSKWNIAVSDQIEIENYFNNSNRIGPIRCPLIMKYMDDWSICSWHNHVIECHKGNPWQ